MSNNRGEMTWRSAGAAIGITLFAAAAVLVLAIVCLSYARPVADDYARAAVQGWFDYIFRVMYLTWSGRWAGIGLAAAILPRVELHTAYPYLIASLALLHGLAYAVFAGLLNGRRPLWGPALMLFALAWSATPGLASGFYWFTGNTENQLPVMLALLVFYGAAWKAHRDWIGPRAVLAEVPLAMLAFIIPAMHELCGLVLCMAVVMAALIAWATGVARRTWLVIAAASAAGFLVNFLAPGNGVRAEDAEFADRESVKVTVDLALLQLREKALPWLWDPKLLSATLLLLLWPGTQVPAWCLRRWRWIIPVAAIGAVLAGVAAPGWAIGKTMPPRTLSMIYLVFLIGWLASAWAIWAKPLYLPGIRKCHNPLRFFAAIVFAVALAATGNAPRAVYALWTDAGNWYAAELRQDAVAREAQASGERVVITPYVPPPPFFIMDEPLKSDPELFPNMWVALYYGFETIQMAQPTWAPLATWDFRKRPPGYGEWSINRGTEAVGGTGIVLKATKDLDYLAIGSRLGIPVDGSESIEVELHVDRVSEDGTRTETTPARVVVFYAQPLPALSGNRWPFEAERNAVLTPVKGVPNRYRLGMRGKKGWSGTVDHLFVSTQTGPAEPGEHFEIRLVSIQILQPEVQETP